MAITVKLTSDSASSACYLVTAEDSGGVETTTITFDTLSGAGTDDNQSVMIERIVGTCADSDPISASHIDLSWGTGERIVFLPSGTFDLKEAYIPNDDGVGKADIDISVTANTVASFKIYVKKANGFPLSMGHAKYRV